jgi:hypothetical protein
VFVDSRRIVDTKRRGVGMAALLCLAGCALGGPEFVDPSPSYPTLGLARSTKHASSALLVDTEKFVDLNLGDPEDGTQLRPSGYTLYDAQGKKLMHVRNYIGYRDSEAITLELDPGKYLVLLDKPAGHPPCFWVSIEPQMLTEVDLLK